VNLGDQQAQPHMRVRSVCLGLLLGNCFSSMGQIRRIARAWRGFNRHMMPLPKKLLIDTSELLRHTSRGIPPLVALADSLYISARRNPAEAEDKGTIPTIKAY
jgi:hypothetical protein